MTRFRSRQRVVRSVRVAASSCSPRMPAFMSSTLRATYRWVKLFHCADVRCALRPSGGSIWAVATTLGVALVSTSSTDAPLLLSMSALVPEPQGTGWVIPIDATQQAWCDAVDHMFPEPLMKVMAHSSAMASFDGQLLAARGPFLMSVDVQDAEAPVATSTIATHVALDRLRVDPLGERAYGLGAGPGQHRHPVIDMRAGAFGLAGQHHVSAWVGRDDQGDLSARLLNGKRVAVAKVIR